MGIEKSEIKIGTIKALGQQLGNMRGGAVKTRHENDGAVTALKMAVPKVEALFEHVDRDLEEGKVPDDGVLATAAYAKTYVRRAADILNNLCVQAKAIALQSEGKLLGLDDAITVAQKQMEAEIQKIHAVKAALESGTLSIEDSGEVPERAVGTHPGNPIADRKAAEAVAADEDETEIDLDSMGKSDLLALAEEREITVDKRWSLIRLRRTLEDVLNAEDT